MTATTAVSADMQDKLDANPTHLAGIHLPERPNAYGKRPERCMDGLCLCPGKRIAKISGDAPPQSGGTTNVAVTFTNDSCTGCSNTAPNQDRNLFITGITVGGVAADLTKLSYGGCTNIPGAAYNSNDGLYCSGTATVAVPATGPVVVSAYGTPDVKQRALFICEESTSEDGPERYANSHKYP